MPRRSLRLELALVVLVSLGVFVPGITRYSLVDPWETHYGEVARNMVKDADLVHMQWPGTNPEGDANEGFHSKPVLTFWMMAAGMHAVGLDHVYSGEMPHDARTMIAIRLPFILAAILGLTLMWWMLARLVSRRLAWLALVVVGTCPFFCLIARQGIPDMPLTATVMGALAMFAMAVEDGDRAISGVFAIRGRVIDARHVLFGICGVFIAGQAVYYAIYFIRSPQLGVVGVPNPAIVLPTLIAILTAAMAQPIWDILVLPVGYLIRAFTWPFTRRWRAPGDLAEHILRMAPITTMRQIYLLGCYALLGVGVLAKGPPGLAVVGFVGVFHIILGGRWRAFYEGEFELKRGLLLMLVIFLPWHLAMFFKEGPSFINDYLFTHLIDRAAVGSVDKSLGTFEHYTSQLGHGMWLWAALLPAAITATLLRTRDTREGRVRFLIGLWAICGVAFFSLVQTKFHHYILPVVPGLAILVAFYLDDLWQGRDRLHPLYAALGVGIVLLITRDLVWEPERWIEMFIFRYDRPWPSIEPWHIDPSDGFLGLGVFAAFAIAITASRWRRAGVIALCAAGLAICLWSLHVYMPIAGTHWGMRDAMRTYYERRTIYGEKLVYYGARELYDDWHGIGDTWTFETFVPDTLQIGQPMTLTIVVKKADEKTTQHEVVLVGHVTRIRDHAVDITLSPSERAKLAPWILTGYYGRAGHPPIRVVDADRLIAWKLYWRGEQFWSGGEIWDALPEMKTSFQQENTSTEINKYLNDRTRAPAGRRYFIISESGHISSLRASLPTPRGRDSFEVLDTTSNKFALAVFTM